MPQSPSEGNRPSQVTWSLSVTHDELRQRRQLQALRKLLQRAAELKQEASGDVVTR